MIPSETILSINAASVGFHNKQDEIRLLENINLHVKKGELIGLIGRNGAGKSTLLRCIVRLQNLLQGSIIFKDKNIHNINPNDFARLMAFVSSGMEVAETMTVREMVSLGRFPYTNWIGRLLTEDIVLINEAISRVEIVQLENRKLSEISDGERQKAMIARTLAQNTALIVLDEPTAFLDLPSKYDIINLLFELTRKGKTVIYSTHDLNIALRFSDKIWLIDNKTIHDGSPEDLILDKTIAGIFESDKIHMNKLTGDFELRKQANKKICLKCDDKIVAYWTTQALQRSGYELVEFDKNLPLLSTEISENKILWRIQLLNENLRFNNIYEMLSALQHSL